MQLRVLTPPTSSLLLLMLSRSKTPQALYRVHTGYIPGAAGYQLTKKTRQILILDLEERQSMKKSI